jgi:6,7-dimethyl-8-ribityllumazine synthase
LSDTDGPGLRVAIVGARGAGVDAVAAHVRAALVAAGVGEADVVEHWVPSPSDLPLAAQTLVATSDLDAVVCVGVGASADAVPPDCAGGLQQVSLGTGVPIALAPADTAEAVARGVVEMGLFVKELRRC